MNLAILPIFIVIGAFAGWLAGTLLRHDLGLLGNTIVGVLGAVIGGFALALLGLAHGLVGSILTAIAGAALLLFLAGLLKQAVRTNRG